MRLKERPYNLLLFIAILLFVVGLFSFNSALEIYLHEKYYIFPLTYLIWTPISMLLIFWSLYLVTKELLFSKALSWTHTVLTLIASLFILTLPYFMTNSYEGLAGMPRHYSDIGQSKTYKFVGHFTSSAVILAIILAVGQLTYLLNLFIGLYNRQNRKNNR